MNVSIKPLRLKILALCLLSYFPIASAVDLGNGFTTVTDQFILGVGDNFLNAVSGNSGSSARDELLGLAAFTSFDYTFSYIPNPALLVNGEVADALRLNLLFTDPGLAIFDVSVTTTNGVQDLSANFAYQQTLYGLGDLTVEIQGFVLTPVTQVDASNNMQVTISLPGNINGRQNFTPVPEPWQWQGWLAGVLSILVFNFNRNLGNLKK